jgi:hypothetical protein
LSRTGRLWLPDGISNLRLLSYTDAAAAVATAVAVGCRWVHAAWGKTHEAEQAGCGWFEL